jgi:GAF domain-containing protein
MRPGERVWIACQGSELERQAVDSLCDLLGEEGFLIEHSARSLLRRADRFRLVRQLQSHRHLGRRVLLVRRLDRLGASEQARLCTWLSGGQPGADLIVATTRLPRLAAARHGLQNRIDRQFKPDLSVGFDTREPAFEPAP